MVQEALSEEVVFDLRPNFEKKEKKRKSRCKFLEKALSRQRKQKVQRPQGRREPGLFEE